MFWYRGRKFPSPENRILHLEASWHPATYDIARVSDGGCSRCAERFPRICFQRCGLLRVCERAPGNPKERWRSQVDRASHKQFSQGVAQLQGEKEGFRTRPA